MFIYCKRNLILPSADGTVKKQLKKEFIGEIEDVFCRTPYFSALVADGKIIVTGKTDKALDQASQAPVADHAKEKAASSGAEDQTGEGGPKEKKAGTK